MPKSGIARFATWLVICGVMGLGSPLLWAQQVPFFVVVHPDNPVDMLTREAVADIFLKERTEWRQGLPAIPVDLVATSPIREAFSRDILDRSTANVTSYWQRQIFSGAKAPPLEVASEAEAVKYVRENLGGIAYISTSTPFDGLRLVALVDAPIAIRKVPPSYTEKALRLKIEGDVVLRVVVEEDGRVGRVEVVKGLKHGLTEEAVRAVKRWRFEPATSGGAKIAVEIDVTVNFKL